MSDRLAGRVAVVTGAAQGLGHAFAIALARAGADIVAADREPALATIEAVQELRPRRCHGVVMDVSVESDTQRMADEAVEAFGHVDILINNAAVNVVQPFDEITLASWRQVQDVNVDGVFLCTKAVIGLMRQQQHGRIINIVSDTVFTNIPHLVAYVTAKSGVIGMTRALATELGVHGITVNSIAPGLTETPRTEQSDPGHWELQVAAQAVKRRGVPSDLVGLAVFLASDEASFITGQNVCVNGGLVKP